MDKSKQTIDQYIANVPEEVREKLEKIRALVKGKAPLAVETISYGIPTFKLGGKNLIHFAAFKKHIGLYPSPAAIVHFERELADYQTSKGAIIFPLEENLPLKLIEKIVLYRIESVGS